MSSCAKAGIFCSLLAEELLQADLTVHGSSHALVFESRLSFLNVAIGMTSSCFRGSSLCLLSAKASLCGKRFHQLGCELSRAFGGGTSTFAEDENAVDLELMFLLETNYDILICDFDASIFSFCERRFEVVQASSVEHHGIESVFSIEAGLELVDEQ